ncbi:conserved hypothetical protein [Theileria equi strain WA]|uniref:Magnesium transporter n=1 Tax=Theileria equi strain WA TaxID=1537102 RepID=L1LBI5_THEEQ|nr:conserved hypothetical protein [Theileria equi strain WA]EKX72696.1 conserved hypothetical protein [Theileria equi strain WA]|eukprot:XP_004832148.1 conserved hypothetical protein [Theileria equi strain WA]
MSSMVKISKIQGKHMVIEVKKGQFFMNEFSCFDLLRKVKASCNIDKSRSNGHITYRDCKQMLSDAECVPNINARFECILVRLFPVSCIILMDSVLAIANENLKLDGLIKDLCHITGLYHGATDSESCAVARGESIPKGDADMYAAELVSDSRFPFEVSVLECCYNTAISHLESDLLSVERQFRLVDDMVMNKKKYKDISIILHDIKQPVSNVLEVSKGFEELMNEILNDSENIKMLEFSNHMALYGNEPSKVHFSECSLNRDLEILLEYFDQEIEHLSKRSRTIYNSLADLERHINMELAITRNEMMRFEVMCSIIGTAFGAGACLSGLFGMNVINGFEESKFAFTVITVIFLIALFIALCITKFLHLKHRV